jgi:hypothetical protein
LSTDELVDVALGTNYVQEFVLNVDLDSINMNDVAPPTVKCIESKCHASLLSGFLLDNPLYFGVSEIFSFKS